MPVHLSRQLHPALIHKPLSPSPVHTNRAKGGRTETGADAHLRLDKNQVDKHDHKVMLDILVAKVAARPAHRQPDVVPLGPRRAGVFRPQRLHGVPALDADGHLAVFRAPVVSRLGVAGGGVVIGERSSSWRLVFYLIGRLGAVSLSVVVGGLGGWKGGLQ